MRWWLTTMLGVLWLTGATLLAQDRQEKPGDKPGGDKPSQPEFKPPFGRGFGGFGFRPPASREEAIQQVRRQLEFARNMVRQLEEQLKRLESGERTADRKPEDRKPDARREGEARKPEKPDKPEARRPEFRKPGPPGRDQARRPGPPGKPGFGPPPGRFDGWRPPFARGPQQDWRRWGGGPRFGPWWPQPGRFGPPAWGWPRWGWTPRWTPPRFAPPRFGPPQRADRSRDLESRLDRLARELEELRRELRQRR